MTEEEAKSILQHILDYREYRIKITDEIFEAIYVLLNSDTEEKRDGNNRIYTEEDRR